MLSDAGSIPAASTILEYHEVQQHPNTTTNPLQTLRFTFILSLVDTTNFQRQLMPLGVIMGVSEESSKVVPPNEVNGSKSTQFKG